MDAGLLISVDLPLGGARGLASAPRGKWDRIQGKPFFHREDRDQ